MSLANSGRWQSFGVSTIAAPDGLYGVSGGSALTDGGIAKMTSTEPFSRVELYYLAQPGGGTVGITIDGHEVSTVDTHSDDGKHSAYTTVAVDGGAGRTVELHATGKVRFFGATLENASGAIVDNMGIVSGTVKNYANNRADHAQGQLAHRGADLIMIALGANEAQWLPPMAKTMTEYQAQYARILAPVRAGRPEATCLVIGPLDQAEAHGDDLVSRPVMPMMVAAQRAAAKAAGCAFFDAYAWAGGKGAAIRWFQRGLVGSDFQHLSRAGSSKYGDALVNALLARVADRGAAGK